VISQSQAIEIIKEELRRNLPGFREAYFHFHYYNFSSVDYDNNPEYQQYLRSQGAGWRISHIMENPELLSLPLYFVHSNGTVYSVAGGSYEKICDQPSRECPLGRMGNTARDRLVYETGAIIVGGKDFEYDIHFIIDAEMGKIVYHIPYSGPNPMPPISVLDNRDTIQDIKQAVDNTETWISVKILANASESTPDQNNPLQGFEPAEVMKRTNDNVGVTWTNYDRTSHTVTSDDGYADILRTEFDSRLIAPGGQYSFVFSEPRYYAYHCSVHPWMKGVVDVMEDYA
jgi:plastocyanin